MCVCVYVCMCVCVCVYVCVHVYMCPYLLLQFILSVVDGQRIVVPTQSVDQGLEHGKKRSYMHHHINTYAKT